MPGKYLASGIYAPSPELKHGILATGTSDLLNHLVGELLRQIQ